MAKPQQPELARSGHTALDPDSVAGDLDAHRRPGAAGEAGPVPVDNQPGHHPEHEQDKPDGDRFVAKVRALAAETADEIGGDADGGDADGGDEEPSARAERLASLAGAPFRAANSVLDAARRRL